MYPRARTSYGVASGQRTLAGWHTFAAVYLPQTPDRTNQTIRPGIVVTRKLELYQSTSIVTRQLKPFASISGVADSIETNNVLLHFGRRKYHDLETATMIPMIVQPETSKNRAFVRVYEKSCRYSRHKGKRNTSCLTFSDGDDLPARHLEPQRYPHVQDQTGGSASSSS